MGAPELSDVAAALEQLAQNYPDPFSLPEGFDELLALPAAQRLLADPERAEEDLLEFLDGTDRPDLARVAVVALAQLPPARVWPGILERLGRADPALAHAYEPGIGLIALPPERIARDLVELVASSGNPNPLLVLQHPAARHVKAELRELVERRELPMTALALRCYRYALDAGDEDLLRSLAEWTAAPDVAADAGLALLELRSPAGAEGIVAGLLAGDDDLRTVVYYELAKYLPPDALAASGYRPDDPTPAAAAALAVALSTAALPASGGG